MHVEAAGQQSLAEVGAEESGATGHHSATNGVVQSDHLRAGPEILSIQVSER
jgi:hypothetical protein